MAARAHRARPGYYYIVAAEYRFVGNQVVGAGPRNAWAMRNNGIMIHSQSAESMGVDQDFPISLEVQLLGGLLELRGCMDPRARNYKRYYLQSDPAACR